MARSRLALCLAALCLAAVTAPAAASAQAEDAREVAHRALLHGDRMLRAGRLSEAIDSWRAGLRALPHWALLLRIGEAYRQMDRCELALPYLRMGYARRGEDFTDEMMPALQDALEDCTSRRPTRLELSTNLGGVRLFVDDRLVGTSPLDPIEITPGRHVVRGEREGHDSVQVAFRAVRGEVSFVSLDLPSPDEGSDEAREEAAAAAQARLALRRRAGRVWGGVMLGVALALAAGSAVLIWADGAELATGQGVATLAPGVTLASLSGVLLGGGISLLVVTPPERAREGGADEMERRR